MSYIKINFGGEERGLKFNQLSLEVYIQNLDYDAINTSSIYATFYAGLKGNSYAKKEDVTYTFEDVCNWVDKLFITDKSVIETVTKLFSETENYKNWISEFSEKIRLLGEEVTEEKKKTKKKVK
jgi:hypothetical protein